MISLQVLYDDVLPLPVIKGKKDLVFGTINGTNLTLPPLVFPYRRALHLVAKTAYGAAMSSQRPHNCAIETCPSAEEWLATYEAVNNASEFENDNLFSNEYSSVAEESI